MFLILFIITRCTNQEQKNRPPEHILAKYTGYSQYTDPGKFVYLFDGLPESLEELCNRIKKQLIHPYDIGQYIGKTPEDRIVEDQTIPTVSLMLAELLKRDENGLAPSRQPEDRLVVACVHHCMLFASICRHRGIPVRIRAGFAKYIGEDDRIRVSHVVCEVWDHEQNQWILVDPDRQRVDFPRHEFEFAYETWGRLRSNNLDKNQYVSRYKTVDQATVHLLCHDLSYVIGNEEPYWNDPSIVAKSQTGITGLSQNELELLDKISAFLKNPDVHLEELVNIQKVTPVLNDYEVM